MDIALLLQYLYPQSQSRRDWLLEDNGKGAYIAEWHLSAPRPSLVELQNVWDSADFQTWKKNQAAARIDQDTGKAINGIVHPLAGIEEQIGILRVQIGEILNAIGLAPTADFDHLNTVATEKIKDGQTKKAAL